MSYGKRLYHIVIGERAKTENGIIVRLETINEMYRGRFKAYFDTLMAYFRYKGYDSHYYTIEYMPNDSDTLPAPVDLLQTWHEGRVSYVDSLGTENHITDSLFLLPFYARDPLRLKYEPTSFSRPDLNLAYMIRSLPHGNTRLSWSSYLGQISHEAAHIELSNFEEGSNLFRPYIINLDDRYRMSQERFDGMNFQRIPRVDEELTWNPYDHGY